MVETIFGMFTAAFGSVVEWFSALMERTGMGGILLIAVVTVFAINILLMPLRGAGMGALQDVTVNRIFPKKKANQNNASSYQGKYLKKSSYQGKYLKKKKG